MQHNSLELHGQFIAVTSYEDHYVLNHRQHYCVLNSVQVDNKNISRLHIILSLWGKSIREARIPPHTQRHSNVENISISWRLHVITRQCVAIAQEAPGTLSGYEICMANMMEEAGDC